MLLLLIQPITGTEGAAEMKKERYLRLLGQKLELIRMASDVDSRKIFKYMEPDRALEIERADGPEITLMEFVNLMRVYNAEPSLVLGSVGQ